MALVVVSSVLERTRARPDADVAREAPAGCAGETRTPSGTRPGRRASARGHSRRLAPKRTGTLPGRRLRHPGQHERRVVIGDDHRGVAGQHREQSLARSGRRLDVREVSHVPRGERVPVVEHAVDDEPVQPVAGPAVSDTERLEHQERTSQRVRPADRPVEGEAPRCPARRRHPIQDERAFRPERVISDQRGAISRDLGHNG